ncbi:MAG: hypothetical protein PVI37_09870 [Gammaproteobacteria bacterium]|jgi:hypothetical protein
MNSQAAMIWGMLFGAVGMGFFVYGRRQRMVVPLVCGVGLMGYSWFMPSTLLLVAVGAVLTILPYFLRW